MKLHSFVFSNQFNYRFRRHAAFWLIWILYYTIISTFSFQTKYGFAKAFFYCLTEVSLSTPLDMGFCYFIIYFLFPRFFFKGRYIIMLVLWMLASVVFMFAFRANGLFVVPVLRGWFGMPPPMGDSNYVWLFFTLFSQLNMEGCIAASIKLGKLWYVKQEEVDLLKKEKDQIQPHETQGHMHPAFLADLLTRIEHLADTKPMVVAQSIKSIRSLVISMLYENSRDKVSLINELALLEQYITLEQITAEETFSVEKAIHAQPSSETIAPFIILPFVENAFRQVYTQPLDRKSISINVSLHHGTLQIILLWSKPTDTSTLANGRNVILQNVSKRLQLIYPGSHQLKMYIEVERIRQELKVNLRKAIN